MTAVAELNKQTAAKRQSAAESKQKSHSEQRMEYLIEYLEEKVSQMFALDKEREKLDEEMDQLKARKKALNDRSKAIYEDLEAEGLDRNAFQDTHKQAHRSESERIKYEATRKLSWTAHGLETGEQLDWVARMEEAAETTEH